MNSNKTKNIIRIIVKAICFLTIASVLTVMLTYAVKPSYGKGKNGFAQYYSAKDNTIDMVYFGGSAAYVYWDPLLAWNSMGYASHLFACDSMQPIAIKYCVIEALKSQNPELLLIDLRPFQYGGDTTKVKKFNSDIISGIFSTICSLDYTKNRKNAIDAMLPPDINKFSYYFDVFSAHTVINGDIFTNPLLLINRSSDPSKGFDFNNKQKVVNYTDCSNITEKKDISEDLKPILADLFDYLKTTNKQVLFIVHSYCITEEHQMKYNYLEEVIHENGFDFLNCNDYNEEIGLDYSADFTNENHVNVLGSDKYTAFLTKYLSEHYDLPDRRNDPKYASWNDDYDAFMIEHEQSVETIKELIKNKKGG